MLQILMIAARSLLLHRRRTLLLGGAIAAVTGLLIVLTALSSGVQQTMERAATTLTTGHLNVAGFYKMSASQAGPLVTDYPKVMAVAKAAVPTLDYAVARGRGWGKLVSDSASLQTGISGIDIQAESGFRRVIHVHEGKLDDLTQPNTVLMFKEQAEKLEVRVGDSLTISVLTPRGVNNTLDVRVVAIADSVGLLSMFSVFVPLESLRTLYQLNEDTTGAIFLYLKDRTDLPKQALKLREAMEKAGYQVLDSNPEPFWRKMQSVSRESWTGQRLDVTTWEDEIAFFNWTLRALDALTVALIGILLVIIVIGIMNTLWITIRERTREIGTLRAIGMQRTRVLWMFMLEAILLGFGGALTGAVGGALVSAGVNLLELKVPRAAQIFLLSEHLWLSVQPGAMVRAVVFISLVTALAALYPSYRAARLKPVTAMHHVG